MQPRHFSPGESLQNYLLGTVTESEAAQLFGWLKENAPESIPELETLIGESYEQAFSESPKISPAASHQLLEKLMDQIGATNITEVILVNRNISKWWWSAAAVLFFLITGGYYLFFKKPQKGIIALQTKQQRFKNDVQPGHKGAVLTLSTGQKLVLDSAENGVIASDQRVQVIKKDGAIRYAGKTEDLVYNYISTERGRQWQLTLNDGSKVWLNAASSIKYPIAFVGPERHVEVTGEVYFEVAKNPLKPFIVKVNGQEIRVLGTHFNINSYADEPFAKTTLLEGSVQVKSAGQVVTILPGQQVKESKSGELYIVKAVDLEETMAWKEGVFRFKETTIEPLMRQLARWYDVDVRYEGSSVNQHFIATIPMDATAVEVLKALELTGGVHFKIDNKNIIVMP